MKKIFLLLFVVIPYAVWAQCNLSNSTDCDCLDGSSNCDLLPDMTASYELLADPDWNYEAGGIIEISVATPNIGHGPLRVIPSDYYICGGDTIYSTEDEFYCPDGSEPHQIITQRIYHKDGSDMSYWERNAGTMTYHPTHGHFHVDDWGIYTLRKPIDGEEDPLAWPILGEGSKLGFCLMDYGSCNGYDGFCVNDGGDVITTDAPNYGLGGGTYDCGLENQGISAGWLDIYYNYLDGMDAALIPGICNGDYKIVVQVDPYNYFTEENEDNNVMVSDITLSDQPEDIDYIPITVHGSLLLCGSETVELIAPLVGTSYTWSNGATSPSIVISEAGSYYCIVDRECGTLSTDTIDITSIDIAEPVTASSVDLCEGTSATLTATADGMISWYDSPETGTMLGTGSSFETPVLFETTMYYTDVLGSTIISGEGNVGEVEHEGTNYSTGGAYNGYEIFDALADFTLESVKVFTDYEGERTIELRDGSDVVLQSLTVDIAEGTSVINLNFDVAEGTNYHLGTNDATNEDTFGDISPKLKRSDAGTSYPYSFEDIVNVTGTSFDGTRWYYFYDWEIAYSKAYSCNSNRVPVEVKVVECTGISEVAGINNLEIYPNPSSGMFTVSYQLNTFDKSIINVINNLGEMVASKNAITISGEQKTTFNVKNMAPGIYTVEIISGNKSLHKQIVIE